MLTAQENELLCRVEGQAPMGRLMRRHWVPALLSEQVSEPNGAPVRVQLFGEKLVAFRDSEGKMGLLGEFLPAPQGVAGVCTKRAMRPAMPIPRLEV